MTKISKEFKDEFNSELSEASYAARKIGLKVVIAVVVLVVLVGIGGVIYTRTIGVQQKNAERQVFKQSATYTEEAASFLAKEYNEYSKATDEADKKTIMQYVTMRYPNLDTGNIDNVTLKQFYEKCLKN